MDEETTAIEKVEDGVLLALIDAFAEQEAVLGGEDEEYCNWYLGILGDADAADTKIDEMYKKIKKGIASRRKGLQFRFGMEFRARVQNHIALQPGKKKSANFLTGKAGKRATRLSIDIIDFEKTVKWLYENGETEVLMAAVNKIQVDDVVVSTLFANLTCDQFVEAVGGLRKGPLLDLITSQGIEIDGVELRHPYDRFFPWNLDAPALEMGEKMPEITEGEDGGVVVVEKGSDVCL